MQLRHGTRRITTWLVVWAVMAMPMAPLLAQAFDANTGWQEICGAVGSRWVKVDNGTPDQPAAPAHAQLFDHCPYCALGAGALGMPPAALALVPAPVRFELPRAFLAAPRLLYAWRSAQARAPPSLS